MGRKKCSLFGSEGFGMREHTGKYTDFLVKIDINKNIESLIFQTVQLLYFIILTI